jgi:cytosine/creatinine deaminase
MNENPERTVIRNALTIAGDHVDVVIDAGIITAVVPAGAALTAGTTVHDIGGMLLVPAATEPHAHLDKAYTADRVLNPKGDLMGAVLAWRAHHPTVTVDDIVERATAAVRASVANGITAIRTHADLGPDIDLRSVEALCMVRDQFRDLVTIEVVPLVAPPTSGGEAADQRARLRDAMQIGADTVGGCPHLEPDALDTIEFLVSMAVEYSTPIDLHMDETLELDVLCLRDYAMIVKGSGLEGLASASHCVSLGMQDATVQREIAEACAAAGISVITLPQTNLFLQSRDITTAPPRGLAPIQTLRAAGVNVAGGADNLQDPFNTVGRADPMETAALLVMAGHLRPEDAFHLITNASRQALGLAPVTIAPGSPADLLAIDAPSLRAAIATASPNRRVFRAGILVASTTCNTTFAS